MSEQESKSLIEESWSIKELGEEVGKELPSFKEIMRDVFVEGKDE